MRWAGARHRGADEGGPRIRVAPGRRRSGGRRPPGGHQPLGSAHRRGLGGRRRRSRRRSVQPWPPYAMPSSRRASGRRAPGRRTRPAHGWPSIAPSRCAAAASSSLARPAACRSPSDNGSISCRATGWRAIRGLEVHDAAVPEGPRGGRVALNLTGVEREAVRRGQVLVATHEPGPLWVSSTDRLLVVLERPAALPGRRPHDAWPPEDGVPARLHTGTDQAGAVLRGDARPLPDGRAVGLLQLDRPIATMPGARLVLRRPRPAALLAGGTVLDTAPTARAFPAPPVTRTP